MAGPEATIERAVCDFAKRRGWLAYKFVSPGNRAVPDRLFVRGGRVVFVEFKAPGKRPTRLQRREHFKLIGAGLAVYVVDSVDGGRAVFVNLDGGA